MCNLSGWVQLCLSLSLTQIFDQEMYVFFYVSLVPAGVWVIVNCIYPCIMRNFFFVENQKYECVLYTCVHYARVNTAMVPWLLCFLSFTSSTSLTESYTEDEPAVVAQLASALLSE